MEKFAIYIGKQYETEDKTGWADCLYNIVYTGNPLNGSTVGADTLNKLGINDVRPARAQGRP